MRAPGPRLKEESRISVDVGGTFADVVLTSTSGDIYTYRLLSTPKDSGEAVVEGIGQIIESPRIEPAGMRDVAGCLWLEAGISTVTRSRPPTPTGKFH